MGQAPTACVYVWLINSLYILDGGASEASLKDTCCPALVLALYACYSRLVKLMHQVCLKAAAEHKIQFSREL